MLGKNVMFSIWHSAKNSIGTLVSHNCHYPEVENSIWLQVGRQTKIRIANLKMNIDGKINDWQ